MSTNIKVSVVVFNKNELILLIKEKITPTQQPKWNIIKGTYKNSKDRSIFGTAIRECQEEASIKVKLVSTSGCYIIKEKKEIKLQFNFLGLVMNSTPKIPDKNTQKKNRENISEIRWFDKKDIKKMSPKDFVSKKIHHILLDTLNNKKYPLHIFKHLKIN